MERLQPRVDCAFVSPHSEFPLRDYVVAQLRTAPSAAGDILAREGARPAAIARELGSALVWSNLKMKRSKLFFSYASYWRAVECAVVYGAVSHLLPTFNDDPAHCLGTLVIAMGFMAGPWLMHEVRAARRGYHLMRQAGIDRIASMRTWSRVPACLGLVLAPVVGTLTKLAAGGFSAITVTGPEGINSKPAVEFLARPAPHKGSSPTTAGIIDSAASSVKSLFSFFKRRTDGDDA